MSKKPNILFIMPDQLRPDYLSCYGAQALNTPNIDQLAQEGIRYDQAYSPSPACVPARASLLTGMNAIKTGVTGNHSWLRPDYAECGLQTWPERLNSEGYNTAAIGKMHFYPWDSNHGFQKRVIAEDKRWIHIQDDYHDFLREQGYHKQHAQESPGYLENKGVAESHVPWKYSVDHFIGDKAVEYLENYDNEAPFAVMVGFAGPHCPYDPCPEFLDAVDPEKLPHPIPRVTKDTPKLWQKNMQTNQQSWNGVDYTDATPENAMRMRHYYAALVKQIDHEIGRLIATLKAQGLYDNTLIVFTSDHGDYLLDHGMVGKGTFYESSCRIPMLVKEPKPLKAGSTSDTPVELTDVTATLLAAAGLPLPDHFDARPLPKTITASHKTERNHLLGMTMAGWMILKDNWKLAHYATGESTLFNLVDDPQEQKNLISDPKQIERRNWLETCLHQELIRSVNQSNDEKTVDSDNTLWSDAEHGRRGQPRHYPIKLG